MPRHKMPLAEAHRLIAVEAARLISDEGIHDHQFAKLKAADRLRLPARRYLPPDHVLQTALAEHKALFGKPAPDHLVRKYRQAALDAMQFLEGFSPRLTGAVLAGEVDDYSVVELQLFAETPEEVPLFLAEQGIAFDEEPTRIQANRQRDIETSVYLVTVDDVAFALTVLPPTLLRHAPLSGVDRRPMARASAAQLRQQLAA